MTKDITNNVSVISKEEVMATKAFQSLQKFKKTFISSNRSIIKEIHNGFNISRSLGYEGWVRINKPSKPVQDIVKELVKTKK